MNDQTKGLIITTLGVLFVVPDALFARVIEASPLTIAFWRSILAGSMLALGIFVFQGRKPFLTALQSGPSSYVYAACLGISGPMFMFAVNMTSVANVVFFIASMPVFASIFSIILLGEKPSIRTIITTAFVGIGLYLVASSSHGDGVSHWSGDILAIGIAVIFALAITLVRRKKHINLLPMAAMSYIVSGLCMVPFAAPLSILPEQIWIVALFGCVFITGSLTLLNIGPRYITSPEVALLILLEAVLAPLLVWFVLGEKVGFWTLIGGAIIVTALAISNLIALRSRRSA